MDRRVALPSDAADFPVPKADESACGTAPAGAASIAAVSVSPKPIMPFFMALLLWCALIAFAPRGTEGNSASAGATSIYVHIHFMKHSVHIHRNGVKELSSLAHHI